ncbi:MAG: subfamily B ATP-binding cassette protein MsbA [Lentimonas sp.]|jgi:subfamily B ATP-binding cassette protein MsbA
MFLKRLGPYFHYLKAVRVQFALGLLFGVISAAASGAGLPFVIKYLVPLVTGDGAPAGLTLALILASIPFAFALRSIGSFFNAYYMAYAGMHVLEKLRVMVFEKVQHLPLAFFHKNHTGDLMSRILGDTNQLKAALVTVVNSLIKEPMTLISAFGFLIYLTVTQNNISFMLIALASVPACVLPIRMIGKQILKKARKSQRLGGQLNDVLNENLASVREIRAYNLESREVDRFAKKCRKLFKLTLKTVKYDKALSPLIEFVSSLSIVFALYVAVKKEIDPGTIASILAALYMCYQPIKALGGVSNTLRKAEASLDRLEYILHCEDTVPETENPITIRAVSGRIQFNNVTFSYDQEAALRAVNVTIEAGQSVALVGPSGAGKTTFANLVPRFYDATEGSITLDGTDLRDVLKADLREQIALVSQEAILFDDTIANNIRMSNPDATLDEVKEAARMAHAHDFIEDFEDGYETIVGERGSRLSGGQRQRVAIARAFLKNAPIIVLDEPTSALDAESEHNIQSALENLSKGRTVIIIAHRFSTIQHADRIFVFDAGEIIATGPHKELYNSTPLYRSLYDKQAKTVLSTEN